MAPYEELTAAPIVISEPAFVDVNVTIPLVPALIGPPEPTTIDPILAITLILLAPLVVIPVGALPAPTVILPVDCV